MATLKEIKKRIGSVKNTQQITRAMKMVSGAKLRRAEENIVAARPYADKISDVVINIARRIEVKEHPLIAEREVKTINLLLVTSDRGLCGAFNMNLIKMAEKFIEANKDKHEKIGFTFVGKKGADYFKRRKAHVYNEYSNLGGKYDYSLASRIGDSLIDGYCAGEFDSVYLIYSDFKSSMSQVPVEQQILPIPSGEVDPEKPTLLIDYIYEPSAHVLLDSILPRYVKNQVFRALLDTLASEHGARMVAMDNASSNASEMIDKLTLKYNRARQAAITKELMEIIGGAEALKK